MPHLREVPNLPSRGPGSEDSDAPLFLLGGMVLLHFTEARAKIQNLRQDSAKKLLAETIEATLSRTNQKQNRQQAKQQSTIKCNVNFLKDTWKVT